MLIDPPESSMVCCKCLISLYILVPNLSSTCHEAESARLRGTLQPAFSQTYPQILWVAQVSHNCRDLYPRGDSICFQSYKLQACLLYTSPSPRDGLLSRMPSSA